MNDVKLLDKEMIGDEEEMIGSSKKSKKQTSHDDEYDGDFADEDPLLTLSSPPSLLSQPNVNKFDHISDLVSYQNRVDFQRGFAVFCQGLFAGYSFSTFFNRLAISNNFQLIENLQPTASSSRTFFYVVSVASLVGSINLFLSIKVSH